MTRTRRRAAHAVVVLAVLGWVFHASATESRAAIADQPALMAPDARVRGVSPRMVAVINEAAARSMTFRRLVDQIGRTDGIVYVAEGQCGHTVRACLLHTLTLMGPNRVLRILVDPRKADRDSMVSIGHELQHALEVLSHSGIRSGSAMMLLYKKEGSKESRHFETYAAIVAGDAVRAELRENAPAGTTSAAADAAVVGLVGLASPAGANPIRKSPFIVDAGEKSPIIDPQKVTVAIRVNNVVGIKAGLLRFAEVLATDLFSQIGVRLTTSHFARQDVARSGSAPVRHAN